MRLLSRNKQNVWFASPVDIVAKTDANGFRTGEKVNVYSKPVCERMSLAISSGANNLGSQGMAELEPYGLVTGYTHRAVTENMNCTMNEESIIWLDDLDPSLWSNYTDKQWENKQKAGECPLPAYRFRVVRKTASKNHLIYYLKEVDAAW